MDPELTLNGSSIPFTTEPIRFLGLKVQVSTDNISAREKILFSLKKMLQAIDKIPLIRRQKKMCVFWWSVSSADLASAHPGIPNFLDGAEDGCSGNTIIPKEMARPWKIS